MSKKEQIAFANRCLDNSSTPCVAVCPYSVVTRYLNLIPDPQGASRELEIQNDPTLKSLHLFRAKSNGANPVPRS
jgi:hypothetical protein